MRHPSPETWMAYLYGELSSDRQAELSEHLRACAECRRRVDAWRRTMFALEAWELPEVPRWRKNVLRRAVGWGVAAVLLLAVGFGAGRLAAAPDLEELQGELEATLRESLGSQLRQELQEEMRIELEAAMEVFRAQMDEGLRRATQQERLRWRSELAAAQVEARRRLESWAQAAAAARQRDRGEMLALLGELEERRRRDHFQLQRALETFASLTGAEFSRTQRSWNQLVAYVQALAASERSQGIVPQPAQEGSRP